jgi:hypothetical protein
MVRNTIGTSKVTITVHFRRERLIFADVLDPNETLTQDHFISKDFLKQSGTAILLWLSTIQSG